MKTFFTVSVLAAIALAYDVKHDIEDFIEDIGRDIERVMENPDAALDEISREFERETEQLIEDAECWFADRNGGDGQCEKRDRQAREDECWNTEGMTWDWDNKECITREQQILNNIDRCVNVDGGEWRNDKPEDCPDCGYCYTAEPWQVCEECGGAYDWDTETCYASWEELEAIRQARDEENCINDGGEWMQFVDQSWYTCYTGEAWQDCEACGGSYNWEIETCQTRQEMDKWYCERDGMEWITEGEESWCNYQLQVLMNKVPAQHRQKMLASFVADFDLTQLEEIGRPVEEGEQEGEGLVMGMAGEVQGVVESYVPLLEAWYYAQEQREEQAFMELANVVVDSVTVDGDSLRTIYGDPESWFMARQPRKAKSVRSIVMTEEEAASNWKHIEFTGPTEDELNQWLESIAEAAEEIGSQAENITNRYADDYEDLVEAYVGYMEPVAEQVEELSNRIGDDIKAVTDSLVITLAKKQRKQAAASSSNAGVYAGISFGVIGLVAAGAMFAACNKKRVANNEEALL